MDQGDVVLIRGHPIVSAPLIQENFVSSVNSFFSFAWNKLDMYVWVNSWFSLFCFTYVCVSKLDNPTTFIISGKIK